MNAMIEPPLRIAWEIDCGACRFKLTCGGCGVAAMAIYGNPVQGDPSCWMFPETSIPAEKLLGAA